MIKKAALRYLGYGSQKASQQVEILLDECIEEIKQTAQPKVAAALFHLDHEPLCIHETGDLIPGKQMEELLADCEKCLLTGGTLGTAMERKIKMYEKVNMTKAVVMDAAASAYLEVFCDEYEENLGFPDRTSRACPGYGDFPIEFNKKIAKILDVSKKLGISMTESGLMIPQKSMLGVVGIGNTGRKKNCRDCVREKDCPFRKRGERCYEIE